MKLYVYDHCPYCVKARMIFGLKNQDVEIITLLNDDESTPTKMVGKKVVPILEKPDGGYMPESMDIVHYIDQQFSPAILSTQSNEKILLWLKNLSGYVNRLLIPRYAKAPLKEFSTQSARNYFIEKKEIMIGLFAEHEKNTPQLLEQLNNDLQILAPLIHSPDACNAQLSVDDIHLFATLRGLSIIDGVRYPQIIADYQHHFATKTRINLFSPIKI